MGNGIDDELARIAAALEGFDLSGFLATIAATLIGALLAGSVAWLIFRQESRERYESQLADTAQTLSVAISRTAAATEKFFNALHEKSAASAQGKEGPEPIEPDRVDLDVGLDMLIARTRKEDRVVAQQIRTVAYELTFVLDASWARVEYATLRRVIAAWVSRRRSTGETRANLQAINMRRARKVANPTISEDELPAAPERYEATPVG